MDREDQRRVYLELKRRQWVGIRPVIRMLTHYNIKFRHNMVQEHKPYPYYRHRIYVYGRDVFRVLDVIDWDFKDERKNRKLKAIKGLYQHERL